VRRNRMTIDRQRFWEWMDTCPLREGTDDKEGWFISRDEGDDISIYFYLEVDEEEDEDE